MRRAGAWLLAAVLLVAAGIRWLEGRVAEPPGDAPAPAVERGARPSGLDAVGRAFRARESGLWLETSGEVVRVLPDDTKGARHQRFVLEIQGGITVLVAHNIDLAPRVEPLEIGDRVQARGLYEWNEQGGVVHWTHRDPAGHRKGGWVRRDGRVFE